MKKVEGKYPPEKPVGTVTRQDYLTERQRVLAFMATRLRPQVLVNTQGLIEFPELTLDQIQSELAVRRASYLLDAVVRYTRNHPPKKSRFDDVV